MPIWLRALHSSITMARNMYQEEVLPLVMGDNAKANHWMMLRDLLPRDRTCDECNEQMNWTKVSQAKDGHAWKCQTKGCIYVIAYFVYIHYVFACYVYFHYVFTCYVKIHLN